MDLDNAQENLEEFQKKVGEDIKIYPLIAPIHEGIDALLYAIADTLKTAPYYSIEEDEQEDSVLYTYEEDDAKAFEIMNEGNGVFTVTGDKIERIVQMASLNTDDGFKNFAIKMRNYGVDDALRAAGAVDGNIIRILDFEFEFMN